VRLLEDSGDFKVSRKLTAGPIISRNESAYSRLSVLVDTQTTGLNHQTDEVIEVGVVAFTYNDDGAIGDVVGVYSGLRQP
jgi:DNA polymerase-3 subunit epsilon